MSIGFGGLFYIIIILSILLMMKEIVCVVIVEAIHKTQKPISVIKSINNNLHRLRAFIDRRGN